MADFLFLTLKSWFYSCTHPTNIADVNFHSLLALAPTPQKQKNPYYCFHWSKISSPTYDSSDAYFSLMKNCPTYQNLCSLLQIIFFQIWHVVYLSMYMTSHHRCSYFKNSGPGKTLKTTSEGYNHECIKLKTGEVDKSYM